MDYFIIFAAGVAIGVACEKSINHWKLKAMDAVKAAGEVLKK